MEMNKVFLVKVKNSETMHAIVSEKLVSLMQEYEILDYGKVDFSCDCSEFFDNNKSFWFSVNDEVIGFEILKVLSEECLTGIISCHNNKFYAFNSLGESIDLPKSYDSNYALVAAYVEQVTGDNFDSCLYSQNFDNGFVDDNEWKDAYEINDDFDFEKFLIDDEKTKKSHINSVHPIDFLEKCHDYKQENKCESLQDLIFDNKENKITKVLNFKEPVIIDNEDDFIKEYDSDYCEEKNESYNEEESKNNESVKLESTVNSSSDLKCDFETVDSCYEKKNENFKKIKLDDEEIDVEELSSLLNAFDDSLLDDQQDNKNVSEEKVVKDEINENILDEDGNAFENEIEISKEELDEIIRSYDQQDEHLSNDKKTENEFNCHINLEYFSNDLSSSETKEFGKDENEKLIDSNLMEMDKIDLSYLSNDSSDLFTTKSLDLESLDDIKDGLLELEEIRDKSSFTPSEDAPVMFNNDLELNMQNLEDEDVENELMEMENIDMSENISCFKNNNLEEKENSLEDTKKCECISNSDLGINDKNVCTCSDEYCDCGCNLEDCKCDETCECDCNTVNECKCTEICDACEVEALEKSKNIAKTCECSCNLNDDDVKCDETCECNQNDIECNEKCECGCNVDECKCVETCCTCDCTCESESVEKSDENKTCEFECCKCVDTDSWDDEYIDNDLDGNKYEALFKNVLEMENVEDQAPDSIFETNETNEDVSLDSCICDSKNLKIPEDECSENCECHQKFEEKDDFEDEKEEYCDVCDALEEQKTIVESIIDEADKFCNETVDNVTDDTNIDLSSINSFDSNQQNLNEKEDLGLFFEDKNEDEEILEPKKEESINGLDDLYVPLHIDDKEVLMNVKLDENILDDDSIVNENTSLDSKNIDNKLVVDENLGANLDNIIEMGQKDLVVDDSIELDLSDKDNLFSVDITEDDKQFDDSIDLNSELDTVIDTKDLETENTENLPYVKIDNVTTAITNSLNEAKGTIKSNKDLADELQKFLDELNIERKKLAEKKLIIAKRNEEAKRLFASNYSKDFGKNK